MDKSLIVATLVQKAVFEKVLLHEISAGFWKNAKPVNHAVEWENVKVDIGIKLGTNGFKSPRNYNFVNPDFYRKFETQLLSVAQEVDKDITSKQLKKQLITLNRIIGGRLNEIGGTITKLPRGSKINKLVSKQKDNVVVKKALATFL